MIYHGTQGHMGGPDPKSLKKKTMGTTNTGKVESNGSKKGLSLPHKGNRVSTGKGGF